jgi:hypothetical protein
MFVHGGGKSRLPVIVKSLRRLGVPIRAVADFDVLNDEHPLSDLVEAAGGDWGSLSGDWKTVKNAVDEKKPELATGEVREEITKILAAVSEPHLPKHVRPAIEKILRRASPWASANEVGKSYVPSGTATQACERFLKTLEILGIFVVETGEMESFARSVGGHSSVWVNEVLKKDVINDPELQGAREFVLRLMS